MLSDEEPYLSPAADVPLLLNQNDLNDLVRDFGLTKEKLVLFKIEVKEYVAERSQVHLFSIQTCKFSSFFSVRIYVCYCSNINGLFEALESEHHSNDWRWFIDLSKASLKAIYLNNGNEKPSISLVHATALKETHKTMELILHLINYSAYNWNICGDLKVISLLLGMQMGYTKHQCFLCLGQLRR